MPFNLVLMVSHYTHPFVIVRFNHGAIFSSNPCIFTAVQDSTHLPFSTDSH